MTRYLVFEPPAGDGRETADGAVFLRDGFAKWALFFPGLWLLRHGLFFTGLLALSATLALGGLAERAGLAPSGVGLALLLGVLVAFEGPSLRAARLRRRGYREAAVLHAGNADDAAVLYHTGRSEAGESAASERSASAPVPARMTAAPRRFRTLLDPAGGR